MAVVAAEGGGDYATSFWGTGCSDVCVSRDAEIASVGQSRTKSPSAEHPCTSSSFG